MNETEIKNIFIEKKAMLEGHFNLSSGRHSSMYLQCALVLQYPDIAEKFGEELAQKIKQSSTTPIKVDAVCAPAIGGIIMTHVLARAFNVRAIFAEREAGSGPLRLRRGFSITPGESVLAVEDVITTGGSLKETVLLLQSHGATIPGVAALAERSAAPVDFGVPKTVLLKLPLKDYSPQECPLCKEGKPLIKPGSKK